jgi:hypothetical protein
MTDDSRAYVANTHMPAPQDALHGAQPDQRIQLTIRLDPALLELATAALDLLNQPPGGTTPPSSTQGAVLDAIAQSTATIVSRIIEMSGTLSAQLDAATAAVETDVAAVAAEVSQLLASMTPGSQITQSQVDRVTAIDTALKAIPPSTPVVIPAPTA